MVGDPLAGQAALSRTRHLTFLSQFLARHSITLSPEQVAPAEGIRAAVATVGALLPALFFHQPVFAWAAFAAFWSCLIEPGGTPREQFRILGLFTFLGAILAALSSIIACAPIWGVLPLLALTGVVAGMSRALSPSHGLLCTLLCCVAAAGTGFPASFDAALIIGAAFAVGGLWAMLLCLVIWSLHPYAPARRAVAASYRLLALMAGELAAGRLRETVHRQAVRSAIEQARMVTLQIDAGHGSDSMRAHLSATLAGAERLFTAMLAVEHLVETRGIDFEGRGTLAAFSTLCQSASRQVLSPEPDLAALAKQATVLADSIRVRPGSVGELVATSASTLATLANGLLRESTGLPAAERPRHTARMTPVIRRHALRLMVGLIATDLASRWLGLHYGFWALVAVLLVIQPSGPTTVVRGLERILGSVCGGVLVLLITPMLSGRSEMLVAVALFAIGAIAMRAVNYTMLVLFLSAQFIVVTEMTMPSPGLAGLRVVDNALGSVIGLFCAFVVCPDRLGRDMDGMLRTAIIGNLKYLAAVLGGQDSAETDRIQRQAGIDTTRAEFARGSLPIFGGVASIGKAAAHNNGILRALRRLSGEATLLRFDMEAGLCPGDTLSAERWGKQAELLEAGAPLHDIALLLEQGRIVAEIAALDRAGRQLLKRADPV